MKFIGKLYFILIIFFCVICFSSCHSKNTPLEDLADLTEDVKSNYKDYTEEDWKTFAQEYELIDQELEEYRDQYSDEEKKEIGRLKGECYAYITKYSVKNLQRNMEDALKEAEGMVEGFTNAIGEEDEEE